MYKLAENEPRDSVTTKALIIGSNAGNEYNHIRRFRRGSASPMSPSNLRIEANAIGRPSLLTKAAESSNFPLKIRVAASVGGTSGAAGTKKIAQNSNRK